MLASRILSANSSGRVNITSWLPSISRNLKFPRRDDIRGWKYPGGNRLILAAVDKASRNGEGVKPFQLQLVQVHLIRFGGQPFPKRPGPGLWCILDEIV